MTVRLIIDVLSCAVAVGCLFYVFKKRDDE